MGCDIHGTLEVKENKKWKFIDKLPDDQSYDWFGIIAGVRNYVNAKPISKPKGIPSKLSKESEKLIEGWDLASHSHSWLTLEEIETYDWEQTFHDGRISTVEKATGKELYKASYTNPNVVDFSRFELKHLDRTAKNLIPHSWKKLLNKMKKLGKKYGKENVRITFFFDN